MSPRDFEQHFTHAVHVAVVTDTELDDDPPDWVAVRHVLDDAGDEILVGDDDAGAVECLDFGRPDADAAHETFLVFHQHPIADANWSLGEEDDPAYEIGDDRLQP